MNDRLLELQWQGQLQDYVTAIAPGVDRWAASSAAGEVVCWQRHELHYYQQADGTAVNCLAYSSDGRYLAAGGQNGRVRVWQDDQIWHQFTAPRVWVDRLAWHPQLPILAVAVGKQVQLWEVERRELLVTLPFDRSSVFDVGWHPSGERLAVAGYGGVAVWQWERWQEYELLAVDTSAHLLAWGKYFIATATLDRQLLIAAIDELERPWIIGDIPTKIRQLQWFSQEPCLVVNNGSNVIALHPQLPFIASSTNDGNLWLQDTELNGLEQIAAEPGTALQWNEPGDRLLLGTERGVLQIWSVTP
jgi:WD40 repeat protein